MEEEEEEEVFVVDPTSVECSFSVTPSFRRGEEEEDIFADFQGTSNGGQRSSNRRLE